MAAIAFPAIQAPEEWTWGYQANTLAMSSPFDQSVQTVELPGMRWTVSFPFVGRNHAEAASIEAFLLRLRGRAKRFTLFNLARPVPRGTYRDAPLVNGAHARGATSISVKSSSANNAKTLRAGDMIGIAGELKMIVEDATANASGVIVIKVEPPMRRALVDGDAVALTRPTATFMLTEDAQQWVARPPYIAQFEFQAVEVFE